MPDVSALNHGKNRCVVKVLAVGLLSLCLSACSTIGAIWPFGGSTNSAHLALISNSLVNAVSQYPQLDPELASVQVQKPKNDFERQVQETLKNSGYQLESVSSSPNEANNLLKASVKTVDDNVGQAFPLYVMSIGSLSAERQFDQMNGQTIPTSELIIRGAEQRSIDLNDAALFALPESAAVSSVAFKPLNSVNLQALLNPEPAKTLTGLWSRPAVAPIKINIFDTMESNYKPLFAEYEDIDSSVLIFPNDSLQLGEVNKVIIEQFVNKMSQSTDVLSVIGCSHGQTNISNGNSVLALGRANRVKEALMFSGVDHEKVLEEGCWAPTQFDGDLPNRGVVLTLKRQKNAG